MLVGTFMLLYARRRAAERTEPDAGEGLVSDESDDGAEGSAAAKEEARPPEREVPELAVEEYTLHCTYCGARLGEGFRFCAGCGQTTSALRQCSDCGQEQFVAEREGPVYCLSCGKRVEE